MLTARSLWVLAAVLSISCTGNAPTERGAVARVESGLLPGVVLKGETLQRWNIAERMAHHKVPGVSVVVIRGGEIEWARGFGVVDAGGSRPVTEDTLFQAASISKPLTGATVLTMVQAGELSLDEDVNDKLTSWQLPVNELTREKPVTLRGILSHSAGLTVHGFPGYAAGVDVPTVVQVLDGEGNTDPVRVDQMPGTGSRYSGGGYTVAQQLMVDVSGKPFPELLRDAVLGPAGMTKSTFEQPLPEHLHSTAAAAHDGEGTPVPGGWHTYPEMAAAGLWTTPTDLAQFLIEIRQAHTGASDRILSQDMAEAMLAGHLGMGSSAEGSDLRFGHGGANKGFRCEARMYVNSGDGVVVMTNATKGHLLVGEIIRAVAAEYSWPGSHPVEKEVAVLDPETLAAYAGSYRFESFTATVALTDGKLRIKVPGMGENELLPESELKFFSLDPGVPPMTFGRNERGDVTDLNVGRNRGQKVE
jgi:CubicO group peptidase (beta-lactamase class C family)